MGTVNGRLALKNPRNPQGEAVEVVALVDTGSTYLCIPRSLSDELGLEACGTKAVALADGSVAEVPYVGPVQVRWNKRTCFVGALIMGDQVLLGAIPLEDLDLLVHPKTQSLYCNPTPGRRPDA